MYDIFSVSKLEHGRNLLMGCWVSWGSAPISADIILLVALQMRLAYLHCWGILANHLANHYPQVGGKGVCSAARVPALSA